MKDLFLLDMDDTLLDFQRTERENVISVCARFGLEAGERVAQRFHEINDGLWKALERGEIQRPQIVTRRFELLFEELGVRADVREVADAYFYGLAEICHPFEGAVRFLDALSSRGRVYIVTNGATYIQQRHLQDAGFLPYTSGVFISDEIGANKPSYAYAEYVAAHIPEFSVERAVYVGDSLTSDKVCAERMGVDFIHFAPHAAQKTSGAVRSYDELLRLIEAL